MASTPETFGNYINGEWKAPHSGGLFDSRSPANNADVVGMFASSALEDLDEAIGAAAGVFATWRNSTAFTRANHLHKAAEILASRANEIGRELSWEEGKTLKEGIGETNRAVQILRYFAGEAQQPSGEHYPSMNPATLLYTVREPLGVIAVITPWNFPIAIPAWKIAPALAFGNTVVFKPASYTPLLAVRFIQALADAGLPPGVVNLVTGSASVIGDPLVRDSRVTGISFTGSGAVGRRLSVAAAERGAKIQLELGGKNPAVVLADADLDHALQHVMTGAMWSSGQKCTATSRAIVDRRIAGEFTARLAERIGGLKVGNPLDEATQIGPVIDEAAVERLAAATATAISEGATLLTGGERLTNEGLGQGYFVAPTLFADVSPASQMGQEELFGPVLGVLIADGPEEAIQIANGVQYGLSASVFTRDLGRAMEFVKSIQAGVVHVNSETPGAEPHVPFGGMKGSSSYSREQGKAARDFYTQTKTVYIDPPPQS